MRKIGRRIIKEADVDADGADSFDPYSGPSEDGKNASEHGLEGIHSGAQGV